MGGAPLAILGRAGEGADAGLVEDRSRDAAEAVFHAGFQRARHLATALFAKCHGLGLFAVNERRDIHDSMMAE